MKTLDEMTLPNGRNICMSSPSPNSWGRWPMKKIPRVEAKREGRLPEHNGSPNKDLANFTELYNSDGTTHRDLFAFTRKIFCGQIPPGIPGWNMLVESSQSIIVDFQPNYDFLYSECNQALIESMTLHSGELSFLAFSRTHFVLLPSSSNSTISLSRAPPIIIGTWSPRSIVPTRLSTHIFDCSANMPKFIPQPSSSPSDVTTTTRAMPRLLASSHTLIHVSIELLRYRMDEFISLTKPLNSVGMEHEFYEDNCYSCRFYKVFGRRCLLDPRYEK
ncbi:hypothetical protein ALC56_03187 [Trachymyrmex septentrionalis]|uniref:Uncharacterized protein n=1 Tax=Trachymyrmex septentrionalis TaxID=34720 RepID=A0A151JZJ2_9HYME|nr:hypothetical protein ALC56_03187 [Trachymyrmex septentrionalis]